MAQTMTLLHTWGGLVLGWLLFIIFLTGTLAVFDKEIDDWMRPEIAVQPTDQALAAKHALQYLQATQGAADNWRISLPSARSAALNVSAGEKGQRGNRESQYLDPVTGQPETVRKTAGGFFFFRFHFLLNLPVQVGIWLTGIAAMGMLVALVSGIIIHKKIFKELFTFRPGKGQRSWLDAHNLTGVMVLPFHLMISYTALSIFAVTYMPAGVQGFFGGDANAYFQEAYKDQRPGAEQSNSANDTQAIKLTAIEPLLAQARQTLGEIDGFAVTHPGRNDARIEIRASLGNHIELSRGESMLFDGVSGELLRGPLSTGRAAMQTQQVMTGLHFAQFGGYPMRWLYFVCGLASCAMIGSGLILFTVKRRRANAKENRAALVMYHAAERLNVAVVSGLMLACLAYIWSSHCLPGASPERTQWEIRIFFIIWLAALGHAIARPWARAWQEQLCLAAGACVLLPLLNVVPTRFDHHVFLETTAVVIGLLLAYASRKAGLHARQQLPLREAQASRVSG